jgi:hypothetical protein
MQLSGDSAPLLQGRGRRLDLACVFQLGQKKVASGLAFPGLLDKQGDQKEQGTEERRRDNCRRTTANESNYYTESNGLASPYDNGEAQRESRRSKKHSR